MNMSTLIITARADLPMQVHGTARAVGQRPIVNNEGPTECKEKMREFSSRI